MSLLYAVPHMQRPSEVAFYTRDRRRQGTGVHKSSKKKFKKKRAIFFAKNYVSEQSAN